MSMNPVKNEVTFTLPDYLTDLSTVRARGLRWMLTSGAFGTMHLNPGLYDKLEREALNTPCSHQIAIDVARTHPDIFDQQCVRTFVYTCLRKQRKSVESILGELSTLLRTLQHYIPDPGYTQGFNFMAFFALLFLPRAHVFWLMVHYLTCMKPLNYFESARCQGLVIDIKVAKANVDRLVPMLNSSVGAEGSDLLLSALAPKLFISLGLPLLPLGPLLMLWDMYWAAPLDDTVDVGVEVANTCPVLGGACFRGDCEGGVCDGMSSGDDSSFGKEACEEKSRGGQSADCDGKTPRKLPKRTVSHRSYGRTQTLIDPSEWRRVFGTCRSYTEAAETLVSSARRQEELADAMYPRGKFPLDTFSGSVNPEGHKTLDQQHRIEREDRIIVQFLNRLTSQSSHTAVTLDADNTRKTEIKSCDGLTTELIDEWSENVWDALSAAEYDVLLGRNVSEFFPEIDSHPAGDAHPDAMGVRHIPEITSIYQEGPCSLWVADGICIGRAHITAVASTSGTSDIGMCTATIRARMITQLSVANSNTTQKSTKSSVSQDATHTSSLRTLSLPKIAELQSRISEGLSFLHGVVKGVFELPPSGDVFATTPSYNSATPSTELVNPVDTTIVTLPVSLLSPRIAWSLACSWFVSPLSENTPLAFQLLTPPSTSSNSVSSNSVSSNSTLSSNANTTSATSTPTNLSSVPVITSPLFMNANARACAQALGPLLTLAHPRTYGYDPMAQCVRPWRSGFSGIGEVFRDASLVASEAQSGQTHLERADANPLLGKIHTIPGILLSSLPLPRRVAYCADRVTTSLICSICAEYCYQHHGNVPAPLPYKLPPPLSTFLEPRDVISGHTTARALLESREMVHKSLDLNVEAQSTTVELVPAALSQPLAVYNTTAPDINVHDEAIHHAENKHSSPQFDDDTNIETPTATRAHNQSIEHPLDPKISTNGTGNVSGKADTHGHGGAVATVEKAAVVKKHPRGHPPHASNNNNLAISSDSTLNSSIVPSSIHNPLSATQQTSPKCGWQCICGAAMLAPTAVPPHLQTPASSLSANSSFSSISDQPSSSKTGSRGSGHSFSMNTSKSASTFIPASLSSISKSMSPCLCLSLAVLQRRGVKIDIMGHELGDVMSLAHISSTTHHTQALLDNDRVITSTQSNSTNAESNANPSQSIVLKSNDIPSIPSQHAPTTTELMACVRAAISETQDDALDGAGAYSGGSSKDGNNANNSGNGDNRELSSPKSLSLKRNDSSPRSKISTTLSNVFKSSNSNSEDSTGPSADVNPPLYTGPFSWVTANVARGPASLSSTRQLSQNAHTSQLDDAGMDAGGVWDNIGYTLLHSPVVNLASHLQYTRMYTSEQVFNDIFTSREALFETEFVKTGIDCNIQCTCGCSCPSGHCACNGCFTQLCTRAVTLSHTARTIMNNSDPEYQQSQLGYSQTRNITTTYGNQHQDRSSSHKTLHKLKTASFLFDGPLFAADDDDDDDTDTKSETLSDPIPTLSVLARTLAFTHGPLAIRILTEKVLPSVFPDSCPVPELVWAASPAGGIVERLHAALATAANRTLSTVEDDASHHGKKRLRHGKSDNIPPGVSQTSRVTPFAGSKIPDANSETCFSGSPSCALCSLRPPTTSATHRPYRLQFSHMDAGLYRVACVVGLWDKKALAAYHTAVKEANDAAAHREMQAAKAKDEKKAMKKPSSSFFASIASIFNSDDSEDDKNNKPEPKPLPSYPAPLPLPHPTVVACFLKVLCTPFISSSTLLAHRSLCTPLPRSGIPPCRSQHAHLALIAEGLQPLQKLLPEQAINLTTVFAKWSYHAKEQARLPHHSSEKRPHPRQHQRQNIQNAELTAQNQGHGDRHNIDMNDQLGLVDCGHYWLRFPTDNKYLLSGALSSAPQESICGRPAVIYSCRQHATKFTTSLDSSDSFSNSLTSDGIFSRRLSVTRSTTGCLAVHDVIVCACVIHDLARRSGFMQGYACSMHGHATKQSTGSTSSSQVSVGTKNDATGSDVCDGASSAVSSPTDPENAATSPSENSQDVSPNDVGRGKPQRPVPLKSVVRCVPSHQHMQQILVHEEYMSHERDAKSPSSLSSTKSDSQGISESKTFDETDAGSSGELDYNADNVALARSCNGGAECERLYVCPEAYSLLQSSKKEKCEDSSDISHIYEDSPPTWDNITVPTAIDALLALCNAITVPNDRNTGMDLELGKSPSGTSCPKMYSLTQFLVLLCTSVPLPAPARIALLCHVFAPPKTPFSTPGRTLSHILRVLQMCVTTSTSQTEPTLLHVTRNSPLVSTVVSRTAPSHCNVLQKCGCVDDDLVTDDLCTLTRSATAALADAHVADLLLRGVGGELKENQSPNLAMVQERLRNVLQCVEALIKKGDTSNSERAHKILLMLSDVRNGLYTHTNLYKNN